MPDPSLLGPFDTAGLPPRFADGERGRAPAVRLLACLPAPELARAAAALKDAEAEIVPATNWSEALGAMERLLPAVAVVHAGFEDGSAIELCSALRRLPGGEEAAILVVGASGRSVRRALDAGATDVMRSPVDWDLLGRRVATLVDATMSAGAHSAQWNGMAAGGRPAAPGAYLLRLRAGGETVVSGLTVIR